MSMSRGRIAALAATAMLVVGACSSGAATSAPSTAATAAPTAAASESAAAGGEPVTITWYHIQNNDPGLSLWKDLAAEYTAAHPNVTIDIQVNENEAFKTKLTTLLQQGDVPDLFQTWGGGGLRQQVEAGLVKDITADIAPWKDEINAGALSMYSVDGKNYGMPVISYQGAKNWWVTLTPMYQLSSLENEPDFNVRLIAGISF